MPTQSLGKFERVLRVGEGRRLKRLREQAAYMGTLEPEFEALSDDELRGKTVEFRQRLENGETLEDLIFEAYAAVREAFRRTIGVRLFDVQLMGGIVLHEGDIAEMKTGEGKTFVAVQPLYLNGLAGRGVHLVTVNDYLAKRDAEWTRPVYEALGTTVGSIQNLMPFAERRIAYGCDVTYGTNSEFGFDYLRDNMAVSLDGVVQRSHSFAIVDEVDSILVDEARTPLIISGEPETAASTYYQFARVVKELEGAPATRKSAKGEDETELSGADFLYDEKFKTVSPAQVTIEKVERALGIDNLYDPRNVILVNHLIQSLKAQSLYKRDVDYVVQDGEVKIVDEFTGRIMEGRRWSEGLHQAIEAKEGVRIREENVTLATITLQNYFRLYEKLAGMTGTAKTEEKEFVEIYDLHVVEIPTNEPIARLDQNDFIFKTPDAKFAAVLEDIVERNEAGQPVLVGTIAVETSEYLSELLMRRGIEHNVLNAKEHEREGEIIKDAGQPGAVTIATNMAGRGVDIKLGDGVRELGGLYVLGTERHEARRIDNQLRGRSGRQGDPGETRFYLSGQDDLVRLFAGDRIYNIMNRFKIPDDQAMEAKILSNQIENAQKKVEEQNFVARKNVLKYDDVMNTQRMVIYEQRRRVLEGEDLSDEVKGWITETVEDAVRQLTDAEFAEDWDLEGIVTSMESLYGTDITVDELREEIDATDREALVEEFVEDALEAYADRERALGPELAREVERYVILQTVDQRWREHLETMDYLREGVHLRAFAQKDPLVEYRGEGHAMFEELGGTIRQEVVFTLFHVAVQVEEPALEPMQAPSGSLHYEHETSAGADVIAAAGAGGRRDRARRSTDAVRLVRAGACGERAQGHRAQRPVLVRQRQEVQEVPWRLTRLGSRIPPGGQSPPPGCADAAGGGMRRPRALSVRPVLSCGPRPRLPCQRRPRRARNLSRAASLGRLAVLVPLCLALSACLGLGEDNGPPPDPFEPDVVAARESASARADDALAEVVAALGGRVVGRASDDACYQGQNNYKVHEGYDHRCTLRRAAAVVFDGDFRRRIARFDRRLFGVGWGCYRTPCPETLSGNVEEYWDLRAAEYGSQRFPISSLPTTTYERGDQYLDVRYGGADGTGRFWLEDLHRRKRGGVFESYRRQVPLDVDRVLARAEGSDYVVGIAIETDYLEDTDFG